MLATGELMQRLTRELDLCHPISRAEHPPPCRTRYAYWTWDDPLTPFAPDMLYVYGGVAGEATTGGTCPVFILPFALSPCLPFYNPNAHLIIFHFLLFTPFLSPHLMCQIQTLR